MWYSKNNSQRRKNVVATPEVLYVHYVINFVLSIGKQPYREVHVVYSYNDINYTYICLRSVYLYKGFRGLCIYIKDSIMFEVCLSYSNSVCELLIVKLDNPSLIIVAIYRPPSSLNSDFEDIITRPTQCFNEMPTPMPNIVVVGDFNLPNFNWDDPNTDCLISQCST